MKIVFALSIFVFALSCAVQVEEKSVSSGEDKHKKEELDPYPDVEEKSDLSKDNSNPHSLSTWDCGKEIIVVEGPNGEKIFAEVDIPCNPLEDVYMGCPPGGNKKAPGTSAEPMNSKNLF